MTQMFKVYRKHDKVRRIKEENDKLTRIELDLMASQELKVVHPLTEEFEWETNRNFNKIFDVELQELWQSTENDFISYRN